MLLDPESASLPKPGDSHTNRLTSRESRDPLGKEGLEMEDAHGRELDKEYWW